MFKTIWSSRGKVDDFLGLSTEDKRRELTNWFDDEMVNQLGDDDLDRVIADDPGFFDDAADDFEYNVSPMIANQFNGGFILDEKFNLVDPGCLLRDANADCEIREDEAGNLVWKEEGRKEFPILGFSDDHQEFLNQLEELDILSTIHNLYPNWDDEDIEVYDVADLIPMDWTLLEQVLTHAKDTQSIGEELEIDEAKAKNPSKLEQELAEIKDLAEEYGREYFTQMPFTSFDNDPISIEMQYPEFFRIVKAFFKEMEILSPEELNDPDELDVQWDQGIDKHDWDVLMKACDKLVNGKGVQFEKEYKTGYNSPLDDDEILANREEESLEEEVIDEARKYEVDNNFVYIGIGDDQSSIGEIWDDGTLELYHPEKFDDKERARMQKDLKDYNISFLDESLTEDVGDGVGVFDDDGEFDPNVTYTNHEEIYVADDYDVENFLQSEEEINKAKEFGMFDDNGNLIIPVASKFKFLGLGAGGWPEFLINGFFDLLLIDNTDDGLFLYPLKEDLNEDVDMGKVNAQKFMKYLKDHNVSSGYMAEKEPEMTAEMGEQPYYLVHLYSQASDLEVYFNEDGTIRWHEEFDEGAVDEGEDTIVIEDFSSWKEMTDWMKDEHWFWSEDWGADLPEDLNEDTVTWP